MHVTVDGRQRQGAERWTESVVSDWLGRVVTHSGLMVITGPQIKQFQGHIHGWAIIAESHVKAELDMERRIAYLELFSCKWFDAPGFVQLCTEMFDLVDIRQRQYDRGLE